MSRTWKDQPARIKKAKLKKNTKQVSFTSYLLTPSYQPTKFFYAHDQKAIQEFKENHPLWTESEISGYPVLIEEEIVDVVDSHNPKTIEVKPRDFLGIWRDANRERFARLSIFLATNTPLHGGVKKNWNIFKRLDPPQAKIVANTYEMPTRFNSYDFREIWGGCPEGPKCDWCANAKTHKHKRATPLEDEKRIAQEFNSGAPISQL